MKVTVKTPMTSKTLEKPQVPNYVKYLIQTGVSEINIIMK